MERLRIKGMGRFSLAIMAIAVTVAFLVTPVHADTVKYVAHAGYRADNTMRLNSKEAFEAAGQMGFWGCECDINEAKGRVIVTTHNPRIGNTSLNKISYKTIIKKVNSQTGSTLTNAEGAATFGDFTRACKKYNMVPFVEVKSSMTKAGVRKSVDFLKKNGMLTNETTYLGFMSKRAEYAAYAKKYARSKYGVKIKAVVFIKNASETSKAKSFAKKHGMNGISIRESQVNSTFYSKSKGMDRHGYADHLQRFNLSQIQRMVEKYGIQTVTTNNIPVQ